MNAIKQGDQWQAEKSKKKKPYVATRLLPILNFNPETDQYYFFLFNPSHK